MVAVRSAVEGLGYKVLRLGSWKQKTGTKKGLLISGPLTPEDTKIIGGILQETTGKIITFMPSARIGGVYGISWFYYMT